MSGSVCVAGTKNCRCVAHIQLAEGNYLCLVKLPKGEFNMGARGYRQEEEPVHRVVIEEDFYLCTTPITQRQARVLMQGAGIEHKNRFNGYDNRPAEQVSADDADACCDWLQHHVQQTGQCEGLLREQKLEVRLPTEAEWEYACKYGCPLNTEYYTGDGAAALTKAGWFAHGEQFGDSKGNSGGQTHDVAQLSPSAAGLYDMHGNVWEWCLDGWDANAYRRRVDGVANPFMPPAKNANRVIRGGSWNNRATFCRAACRGWGLPGNRFGNLGFRVGLFPVRSCQTEQSAK